MIFLKIMKASENQIDKTVNFDGLNSIGKISYNLIGEIINTENKNWKMV